MACEFLHRDAHLKNDGRPKHILALDGGGLRGVLTLGILARTEARLAERHGSYDGGFRLAHYFEEDAGAGRLADAYYLKVDDFPSVFGSPRM